jgi:hypothetical protein
MIHNFGLSFKRTVSNYLHDHHINWGESLLLDDGEEEFGNIIRRFGIEYRHIEPGMGLVPALQIVTAITGRQKRRNLAGSALKGGFL